MAEECHNCSGGTHHICSPPCGCGCPTSHRQNAKWLQTSLARRAAVVLAAARAKEDDPEAG